MEKIDCMCLAILEGHGDRVITMRKLRRHICNLEHHQTESGMAVAVWTGLDWDLCPTQSLVCCTAWCSDA